jgi:DNA-binding MarR family transcriptional regulator
MPNNSVILTDTAIRAFLNKPLSKAESIALWWLVANLPPAGDVMSLASLAETLKVPRARMSQTVKRLCEIGFLVRGVKLGISYHYKLNPVFVRILT